MASSTKVDIDVKKLQEEIIQVLNTIFFSVLDKELTNEERNIISSAYKNINAIRRNLCRYVRPHHAAIRECRSKIVREISDICNKLSNPTIKDFYRPHLHKLKTTSSCYTTKRTLTTLQIYGQLKRKASSQQPPQPPKTGRRKQSSIKAQQLQQEDISINDQEENYLEKLILEEKDYNETARFIETSLHMHTTKEDMEVLRTAYDNFNRVYMKQHKVIMLTRRDETKGKDLNVPHLINNHRSLIVKELSDVCDKVSNVTIKEAYLHHIDEFKTHAKPKKHTQMFINQKETPEIFSKMKGGSGSGSSKSATRKPRLYDDFEEDEDDYGNDYHDCNKHCFGDNNYPRFGRIGNWDPKVEGFGADLLHLPKNHSVKVGEVFKARDKSPKRRRSIPVPHDLFDDIFKNRNYRL